VQVEETAQPPLLTLPLLPVQHWQHQGAVRVSADCKQQQPAAVAAVLFATVFERQVAALVAAQPPQELHLLLPLLLVQGLRGRLLPLLPPLLLRGCLLPCQPAAMGLPAGCAVPWDDSAAAAEQCLVEVAAAAAEPTPPGLVLPAVVSRPEAVPEFEFVAAAAVEA
jgi:hypothetical protein